jgi:hypothetical protein
MSDEIAIRWDLSNQRLMGPGGRVAALGDITEIKTLGSAVQVITRDGS